MANFFIVGAQKAGTTALHKFLSTHSKLALSTKKELHFFDNEKINWTKPDYRKLEAGLGKTRKLRGEATPVYLYWPQSMARLHSYDPKAKIIIMLRHPVYRAHSHWRMEVARGAETLSFSDAIRVGRDRVQASENGAHRVYSYVERGFYAAQIDNALRYYPRDQIYFATTDQLWLDTKATLSGIERFLDVPAELDPGRDYVIAATTNIPVDLNLQDFEYLMALYQADITETMQRTGLVLTHWHSQDYREPIKQ